MKAFYVTMGRYDMVAVIEMPDDAAYASAILALGSKGGVRTESLTAFTQDEYKKIIESLP